MTTFPMFAAAFRYLNVAGVTDVADLLASVWDEIVDHGTWISPSPSGAEFETTLDALGRHFSLHLHRLAATRLGINAYDQFGNAVVGGEVDIDVAGNDVQIFSGPHHLFLRSERAGTPECGGAALLNLAPASQYLPLYSVCGCYHRRQSDGAESNSTVDEWAMWDAAAAVNTYRVHSYAVQNQVVPAYAVHPFLACSGSNVYYPVRLQTTVFDRTCWVGRVPQCILGPDTLAGGAEVTVPIGDAGETGVFKESGRKVGGHAKMLIRKS